MYLIADSGSSKTEWRLFDSNGQVNAITSKGLNPLLFTEELFIEEIVKSLPENWVKQVKVLWFYGAGCVSSNVKIKTQHWLNKIFTNASVEVESDLIAAARACCGTEKGIIAILGTGSNSGLYDGKNIVKHIKPLGFILGDEGSGTALGKALLKKLLRNEFSKELSNTLQKDLELTYDEIIANVYRSDFPNKFLASTTRLLHKHIGNKEIEVLIEEEFNKFVMLLKNYDEVDKLTLHFVGSIAFYFESILSKSMSKNKLIMGSILRSPADTLVSYHLKSQ